MAIGLGLMLGFEFPQNFNSPYKACGFRDFWRRWHMSLSRWLRDYLYISLGGSRRGRLRTYVNVMLTMLLGGLWHGANWTFVLWGAYHGLLVAGERALGKRNPLARLPRGLKRAGTFLLVTLGWVLFRSASMGRAGDYLGALFGARGLGRVPPEMRDGWVLGALAACAAATWGFRNAWEWRMRVTVRSLAWAVPLFLVCLYVVLVSDYSPFLYFQF
jgi:alginate O-acetyltransferase complex protein AlgI